MYRPTFSKVTLKNRYQQIQLDVASSQLKPFQANEHIYRFTRLPFSKTSSEILQRKINENVHNISDFNKDFIAGDIIRPGINQKEHDENLELFLLDAKKME